VRACPDARLPPTEEEVAEFAQISVEQNLSRALEFVEAIGREGISLEAVLLQLVAPAARLLGDQWLSDVRTFTDVTFGLATIHQVVNVLGPSFASGIPDRGFVVLVAAPSEQHTLGIYLLAEFIRRAGWGVQVEPSMPEVELIELVRDQHVAMVGISVSNLDLVASLARLVTRVKLASRNHDLLVMVGATHAIVARYRPEDLNRSQLRRPIGGRHDRGPAATGPGCASKRPCLIRTPR
jgi:methanogenic corrinoid protein MtbC1